MESRLARDQASDNNGAIRANNSTMNHSLRMIITATCLRARAKNLSDSARHLDYSIVVLAIAVISIVLFWGK